MATNPGGGARKDAARSLRRLRLKAHVPVFNDDACARLNWRLRPHKRRHMSLTNRSRVALLVVLFFLAGCGDRKAESGSAIGASAGDRWLGQWNGPEGTFLRVAGGSGKYEITIQNLDGPRQFQGDGVDGQIQFERNGVKESIRATNGAGTGMKWLSDKSNCLTVRPGEGYCRD